MLNRLIPELTVRDMASEYRPGGRTLDQKKFPVQDPEGYLLRFTRESDKKPQPSSKLFLAISGKVYYTI